MEIQFNGKRALVTGATKGIGRAIAIQLAKYGAEVIAVGRSVADLKSLKEEHPSIHTISVDLSNWNSTRNALKDLDPVDLLVNNAGTALGTLWNTFSEEDINKMFDINVKATMNVTQIVTEKLIARKMPGAIVNVSSQGAKSGVQFLSVYCASKGAVDAFTRAAALELGSKNIRINCVNPTVVLTELTKKAWSDPARAASHLARLAIKRFCDVQEVVDAVIFLLSDKASMITGTSLSIDGGYNAI